MKVRTERIFDYPCEFVCKQLMDTDDGGYDMAELENVTKWKPVKEHDDGTKRVATKEWCAHSQIPKALQAVLTPKMLSWYEHSVWNRVARTYSFKIEPFYLKQQVFCEGVTAFKENGKDKCLRTFNIELKIKIPVLGPIAEGFVMDVLKKNEEQDYQMCLKAVAAAYKKKK